MIREHDTVHAYTVAHLLQNPPPPPRLVPLWNLDALRRCVEECNDYGCERWIDDPAAVGIGG